MVPITATLRGARALRRTSSDGPMDQSGALQSSRRKVTPPAWTGLVRPGHGSTSAMAAAASAIGIPNPTPVEMAARQAWTQCTPQNRVRTSTRCSPWMATKQSRSGHELVADSA
jgi:hypothetical protein